MFLETVMDVLTPAKTVVFYFQHSFIHSRFCNSPVQCSGIIGIENKLRHLDRVDQLKQDPSCA